MSRQIFSIFIVALLSTTANAQPKASCDDYPYGMGIDVEDVQGGTKILATGQVAVSMDDIDSIMDAKEEATLEAKSQIAKFLTEDIKSDSAIGKAIKEQKQSDGNTKKVSREEMITRVKVLRNSASALLRGVVPLGSCYTKGREYRVTVGLKPETIRSAERTAGAINSSVQRQGTIQAGQGPGSMGGTGSVKGGSSGSSNERLPLQQMDGHSDTSRIKKF